MKVIIAGSRTLFPTTLEITALLKQHKLYDQLTVLVAGGAVGVDQAAEQWAKETGKTCVIFKPGWKQHGKVAGYLRNKMMGEYGDVLLAIWNGKSKGTKHMIDIMDQMGKRVYTCLYTPT